MMPLLDLVTNLCIGLLVGVEFAVSAFINPALWKLESRPQFTAIRLFAIKLGTVMPFWYGAALLLLILETIFRRHESGSALLIAACAIWAAVILLTILFLVPINNRLARTDPDALPANAAREHRKWDALHRMRIAALGIAMICFLLAVRV